MSRELDTVVLVRHLPALGLEARDIGAVVHVYEGGEAAKVEFVSGSGETVAVETLRAADIRTPGGGEILHARALTA